MSVRKCQESPAPVPTSRCALVISLRGMIHLQSIDVATLPSTSRSEIASHEIAQVENRRESRFIGLSLLRRKPIAVRKC
ncbi:MAG: hypothetical protein WBL68_15555 [Nitrososphaeraceae archaeon]